MNQRYDFFSLTLILVLISIGCVSIYSASFSESETENDYFTRQLIWCAFGIVALITVSFISIRFINRISYWLYGISLIVLFLVLFIGKVGQGAERWLEVGPIQCSHPEWPNWLRFWPSLNFYLINTPM